MKKKIVNVLLSTAVITAMIFSVTACGSKNDDVQNMGMMAKEPVNQEVSNDVGEGNADDADADDVDNMDDMDDMNEDDTDIDDVGADEDNVDEDDTEEDTMDGDVYQADIASGSIALEEWIDSEECAQFSEMMNAGLKGMEISFEVEGDTISMIFTMTDAIDVAEDAEEAMNSYFTSNAAIFEAIRDQLISETGNQNTVLSLVYRNADGSEIFSMDF